MKKRLPLFLFALICSISLNAQTMSFGGGASHSGFSLSGFNAGGGTIWIANLGVTPGTITKSSGTWNVTSVLLGTPVSGSGGDQFIITSNKGDSKTYTGATKGTVALGWTGVTWIKFNRTSGSGTSPDIDNVIYTVTASCTPAAAPSLSLSSSTICAGQSTTVSTSSALGGSTSWKAYSGPNGTGTSYGTLTGGTPSLSIAPSGSGTIYVRGEGGSGCSAGADGSISVTVNSLDNASFSYTGSPFCQNGSDGTVTASTAGTYSSSTGLSINGTSGLIDVSASTPGTYTISHTTTGSCPNSSTQSVTITATDDATFSYTGSPFCQNGSDATVTATTAGTYSAGTGLIINGTSGLIDVSASTPGTYTVTHTTTGSCPNSSTQSVTITAGDDATFSYTGSPFCQNGSDATVTAATAGTYSAGTGLTINGTSGLIDVSASTPGTYSVTHITTGSCPSFSSQSVTITATDDATFSYSSGTYCNNEANPSPTAATAGTYSAGTGLIINGSTGVVDLASSTPGTYTITHTTTGSCPNTSTTSMTIKAITFATINRDVCDSYTSPSGKTWTTSGTRNDTIPNAANCDSVITVNLIVRYKSFATISPTAYETYTSPGGKTWTTSATYLDTIANDANCDSIITINLTIINRIKTFGTGFTTLDDVFNQANNAAPNTAEVWVKEGTYYPGGQSSTSRDSAYVITNPNTTIYGGFSGNETELSQRNPTANQTILCGDIGTPGDSTDNAFHVLVVTGQSDIGSGFVLDGLEIRDGNADGNGKSTYAGTELYHNEGGGISIVGDKTGLEISPTISNCQFDNNYADYGGSIYIKMLGGKSFANITNCTFKNGNSIYGTIYNDGQGGEVSPNIVNCVFDNNTSQTSGAAIYNYGYGGKSSPTITSCVFNNNVANAQGGAIYNNGYAGVSSPVIFNSTFHSNRANSSAGAMYSFGNAGTCQPKVTNSIFYKNTKGTDDDFKFSEFYNYAAYPYIKNSSLQRASSTYTAATLNSLNSGPNNIFQTNPNFEAIADGNGADDVWRTGDDGLRLSSSSTGLLNGGTNTGAPATDILGNQRMGTTDMGAYEYVSCGLNVKLATSVKTHTATQTVVDDGFVCYCNSDNELLLALDTNGTGAVITPSQVKLYIGNPSTLSYNSAGGMITNTAGGVILERRWDVEPTTQPTSPVTVRYFYTNDNYDDIVTAMAGLTAPTTITSPSQLQFYKVTGGSTATFPNPHDAGVTGIVLSNGTTASTTVWVNGVHGVQDHTAEYLVSSFSGGGGGGGGGSSPLPVELIQFDAVASASHTADLTWKTASELNNSHFVVERSYNGRDFEEAAIVQGNGTTQNVMTYNHNDNTIEQTQNMVFYRLRQVDFDGTQAYSPIRRVDFDQEITPNKVSLYPNPTNGQVTVRFEDDEVLTHSVKVIDNIGRQIYTNAFEGQAIQLDLSTQPTGVYFIILDSGESFKVVKE